MHQKVKELSERKKRRPTNAINDRDETKLTESRQVQSRWKEYIEDLYDKSSKPSDDEMKPASVGEDSMGPDILYDEFEKALSELKNGKATGIDGIPAEILKALVRTDKTSCLRSFWIFTEKLND